MGVESYKHKFAKAVLADWLRSAIDENCYIEIPPVQVRTNRGPPFCGVYEEYPICLDGKNRIVGAAPIWDEDCWTVAGETVSGWGRVPPTYDECVANELLPIVIFDLMLIHKGAASIGFEVVHKNDISKIKRDYIDRIRQESSYITVYRIEADWILSQVKRPATIRCERVK